MADFLINVVVNTRGAEQGTQRVDRSLTAIERSLTRINRLLSGVFAFQALAGGIRAFAQLADSITLAENRFRAVGVAAERTGQITRTLFGIANDTRVSFDGVTEVFQRASIALSSLGAEEAEVIAFTRTLTQTIALSGATTAEAEGALRQFTQGLAANRLSGQELNSVLEQLPFLAGIIADELGVLTGDLRGLANQGLITGDVLRSAIANAGPEIARLFANTIPTLSQSFVVLNNRVIEVAGGFLQTSGISEGLARSFIALANNIEVVIRAAAGLVTALAVGLAGRAIPLVIRGIGALTAALVRNPFGALAVAVSSAIGFLTSFSDQIEFTSDGVVSLADVGIAAFNRFRDGVANAFNTIVSFINQFIPSVDLINVSFEDVARRTAESLDVVVAVVNAAQAAIGEVFGNFGPVLQDAFTTGFNGAIDVVEDGINFIINGVGELPGALFDVARDAVLRFASVFDIGFSDIVEFARSIPDRIADAFTGLFSAGEEAGASLIEGIDNAINVGVDPIAGRIEVELGRLENPASGALRQVGDVAGQEFARTLEQAPVSQALDNVLTDARARALPRAQEVGAEVGQAVGREAAIALLQEKANLTRALEGLLDAVTTFTGLTEQEFQNLTDNISTILGGIDLQGAFNDALQGIAALVGVAGSELTNAFGGVLNILSELGFELEDVFGRRGTQAIRILSVVTSEQFQGILATVQGVLGRIGPLFSGLIPTITSFGASAVAAFQAMTTAATSTLAALGPIGLVIAGIGVIITATAALFGAFGDRVQRIAQILAVVFAPFIFSIQLIISLIGGLNRVLDFLATVLGFLADLFRGVGDAGSTAGRIITAVFAPIIIPIRLIVQAIEFLIDLFSNLGNVGGSVGRLLAAVLAPIVIPIRLIIQAIEFLIDLFQNLGNVGRIVTGALSAAFNGFLAVGRAVFNGLQAAGQATFSALQSAGQATFNAIQSVGQAAFNALAAAGRALQGALTATFNAVRGVATQVFNQILSVGSSVFNTLLGLGRNLLGGLTTAFRSIASVGRTAFNALVSAGRAAFDALISAARAAAKVIGGILNGIGSAFKGVVGGISGGIKGVTGIVGGIGGGIVGGIGGGIVGGGKKILKGGKKLIKKLFADGGVINGPVSLFGEGAAGRAFRRGGVLGDLTGIANANRVTPTSQLGVAGEAGPEAIMPLTRTSQGLGVTARLDPSLLRALETQVANPPSRGTTIINRIVLINTSSETLEELEEQVLDLDASIEQRADARLAEFLSEVA